MIFVVLRYSPYSKALYEVINSGSLGKLINVQHMEPIGYYHFAHSYVRGNWGKEADSSFSLMTKSCQLSICVAPSQIRTYHIWFFLAISTLFVAG